MYYYIYDSFVQAKEYQRELAAIENRLADFGITGTIGRLSLFRDAGELVTDEVRRGAKTIVVVGNDSTVRKVVGAVVASRATLGIIPLGPGNTFAKLFGVPSGVEACEVLSRRIVVPLDVGKINGKYFLSRIRIPRADLMLHCEGRYDIHAARDGEVQIKNVGWVDDAPAAPELGDPHDGMLETVIDVREPGGLFHRAVWRRSTIPMRTITIEGAQPIQAFVDEEKYAHPRLEISILPRRLRVITGRDRMV